MKLIFHLHPHATNDPYEVLDLIEPQKDSFGLLQGLLTHEPSKELVGLLKQISALQRQYYTSEAWYSHYYYRIEFIEPGMVIITHEYQPDWGFKMSYGNLSVILHSLLDYRTDHKERHIELRLSDQEGPFAIADAKNS